MAAFTRYGGQTRLGRGQLGRSKAKVMGALHGDMFFQARYLVTV